MILVQPNKFINETGSEFIIPFDDFDEHDLIVDIIDFKKKVVMVFTTPDDHEAELRNIICFDRDSSEVLWLIESGLGWMPEYNHNMYLEEDAEDYLLYSSATAFHNDDKGHLWIEEDYNQDQQNKRTYKYLVKKKLIARHPDYQNERLYQIVEDKAYWIRSDTHELVLRNWDEEDEPPEERGYCGLVHYTDMTAYEEEDCLLVVASNGGTFLFDTDLETGKVKPAYAMTGETK